MPVQKTERPVFSFTKGLNTDASEVIFPTDFSTDEQNFELMLDGSRRKRRGLEAETEEVLDDTQPEDSSVRTFKWRSVDGNPDLNFHCVQIGSKVYFMDDVVTPSDNERSFTLDLETIAVDGFAAQVGETVIDMAFGRGHALIVGKYIEPHFIEYDLATDSLITTPIDIRERDFQGVEDGVDNQTKPATLSDAYQYNLINQGWVYGDILAFQTSQGSYPSKNMIPWYGYRRATVAGFDPNDGTKQFSPDKLIAEIFQDAPAPKGHFVRNPFNTNAVLTVDTETVKNYVRYNSTTQSDPATNGWEPDSPNDINIPSSSTPTATTLIQCEFQNPHFLSVGEVVQFFTETRGKFGSLTGDGNRWWEIQGNYTVEEVVDDNTIKFYFTLTNDSAGWRTSWPYSYWPVVYAFVGGDILEIDGEVIDERPTAVAFFAGRAVYAGVPHPKLGSAIFFSQVVEVDTQYGKCYQVADPTSDKISDLLPTDGLVLRIPEVGRVYKLQNYGSSLIVWASNGVWQIGPGADGYFTAVSYSVRKLSNIQIVNGTCVLDCEGTPMGWASSGVFAIIEDTNTGFLVARSLTEGLIDVYFADLGEAARRTATGDYDEVNKRAVWVYQSGEEYYALVYDVRFGAFTPWKFEAPVYDVFTTTDRNADESTLRFIAYDDEFLVATATSLTFQDFGTNLDAYLVCGFDTAQSPARKKHAPVVTVFCKRTELFIIGDGVPPLAVILSGTTNDNINELSWTTSVPRSTPIDGYRLYDADTDVLIVDIPDPSTLSYDHGPLEGGVYRYYVVAYAEDGLTSIESNVVELEVDETILVAVASNGGAQQFATSSDGITWALSNSPAVRQWGHILWVQELGLFVASCYDIAGSGYTTRIATSPDGTTWTLRDAGVDVALAGIAYSAGENRLIVAVHSSSATINAVTSTDGGVTWTTLDTTLGLNHNIVRAEERNEWMMLGTNGGSTKTAYSNDGTTWIGPATDPSTESTSAIYGAYVPELNQYWFVSAVGSSYTSSGTDNMTRHTFNAVGALAGSGSGPYGSMAWNGTIGVACSGGGVGTLFSSTDGQTWTERLAQYMIGVTWASRLGLFVAVGVDVSGGGGGVGTGRCYTSPDGINWTQRTIADQRWRSVAQGTIPPP